MNNATAKATAADATALKPSDQSAVIAPAKGKKAVAAKAITKAPVTAGTKSVPKKIAPKQDKVKKPKMVRDSFTFPKDEYSVLDALKLRAAKLGKPVKKTELLRAGVKSLAAMPDAKFLAALQAVPSIKTGRPAKPEAD